ncbi:hypothetical protein PC128_g23287 [Phytophthora cactorum]|nr:hypothetical protein PC128_g23287 [Phytophthora cactorum]
MYGKPRRPSVPSLSDPSEYLEMGSLHESSTGSSLQRDFDTKHRFAYQPDALVVVGPRFNTPGRERGIANSPVQGKSSTVKEKRCAFSRFHAIGAECLQELPAPATERL